MQTFSEKKDSKPKESILKNWFKGIPFSTKNLDKEFKNNTYENFSLIPFKELVKKYVTENQNITKSNLFVAIFLRLYTQWSQEGFLTIEILMTLFKVKILLKKMSKIFLDT